MINPAPPHTAPVSYYAGVHQRHRGGSGLIRQAAVQRPDRTHRIGSLARTPSRAAVSNSVVPCPGQARVGRGFLFEFGRAPGVTPESRPGVPGGSRDSACTGPADLFEFGAGIEKSARLDASTLPSRVGA